MEINLNKVASLVIGKKNSVGFPGKNIMKINGFPSCEYSFMASKKLVGGGERCASLDKRSSRGLLANRIIFDNLSIGRRTVALTKRHQLWAVKTMISTWTEVVGCDVQPRVKVDVT